MPIVHVIGFKSFAPSGRQLVHDIKSRALPLAKSLLGFQPAPYAHELQSGRRGHCDEQDFMHRRIVHTVALNPNKNVSIKIDERHRITS